MASAVSETVRERPEAAQKGRRFPASEITLVASDNELLEVLVDEVRGEDGKVRWRFIKPGDIRHDSLKHSSTVVYVPSLLGRGSMLPQLDEAAVVFSACAECKIELCIVVASAAVYGANFRNPGLLPEEYPLPGRECRIPMQWLKLETLAQAHEGDIKSVAILRCCTLLSRTTPNAIAHLFFGSSAMTMPGHDPSIQLLSARDLARAVDCMLRADVRGIFNVSPDGVIPLRTALVHAGVTKVPVPRALRRCANLIRKGLAPNSLDYARYSWTISNEKVKALGFQPQNSSWQAVTEFCLPLRSGSVRDARLSPAFDDFGMDKAYIHFYGKTLFRFLSDWYWRIEVMGAEHIPRTGRGVLTGMHRGFMPWDGVMALHLIVKHTGRYPRFLIHPSLVKFPFLSNFMTKLGGMMACQENADYVLERNELLGVFPEGIQGAFVPYSKAYKLLHFHRDAFVKMALRHQAPIVPFVTVGSAEIFPILAKIKSRFWTQYSQWPAFPITPTFPLVPLPLPSKWHTRFLPPIHVEKEYPPSAASDAGIVRMISARVRDLMQNAVDDMLKSRHSIFSGSIFPERAK
jgi:1-acyl-sn-glycerol-3-phosphate acyltransferase